MSDTVLTDRQKFILGLTVQEYVKTGKPVSSSRLVVDYNLEMSSATVRNEMVVLEETHYLRKTHDRGGRAHGRAFADNGVV